MAAFAGGGPATDAAAVQLVAGVGVPGAAVVVVDQVEDVRVGIGSRSEVEDGIDVARIGAAGVVQLAVLGSPADCPNPECNRYLELVARRCGVPVYSTLDEATPARSAWSPRTSAVTARR